MLGRRAAPGDRTTAAPADGLVEVATLSHPAAAGRLRVLADPAIADPLSALAEKFNANADPVGDHCPNVEIKAVESGAPSSPHRDINLFPSTIRKSNFGCWPMLPI